MENFHWPPEGALSSESSGSSADRGWIQDHHRRRRAENPEADGFKLQKTCDADLDLGPATEFRQLAQMAMDSLSAAIFVVDSRRRIGLANRAGRQMLSPGNRLCLLNGMLSSPVSVEAAKIAQAVQQVCTGRADRMAVILDGGMGRQPLQILLSAAPSKFSTNPDNTWALLLAGPSTPPPPDIGMLQMMFGLTPREAETAADLAQGCSVEESAIRRNVALSTVRSHLNSALAKTRTGTQARLMLALRALPALASAAKAIQPRGQ